MFLLQNLDCKYSLEPPQSGGSNMYQQSMFSAKNNRSMLHGRVNVIEGICIIWYLVGAISFSSASWFIIKTDQNKLSLIMSVFPFNCHYVNILNQFFTIKRTV